MIKYIYVAGPYTKPSPNANVNRAIGIAEELFYNGFIPFVPHLYHLWDTVIPGPYSKWMQLDTAWLERCDAILRFSGDSPGADEEVRLAIKLGKPVFHSVLELINRAYGA